MLTARLKASTVMRTFEERVILQAHREQTLVLELQVRPIMPLLFKRGMSPLFGRMLMLGLMCGVVRCILIRGLFLPYEAKMFSPLT